MKRADYRLGIYEKALPNNLSFSEKLQIAKECGFDYFEISIDETDEKLKRLDMQESEKLDLIKSMYEKNIKIETMCLSGHRKFPLGSENKSTREKSLEIMKKAIILANDLGIRIIQIAGYDVYYEESNDITKELFYEGLKESVVFAANYGVILAFETMETPFLNTITKAKYWVDKINSPYLQIYPDSGNITNAALPNLENVVDDILNGKGNIAAFHLKESVPGIYREIPFGTGQVDFRSVIENSLRLGVRRFTCEFWFVGQKDWLGDIKHANNFFVNIFDEIEDF